VFDGHAGTDAAIYSVSHLHQFLAESSYYPTDPERALKDAFSRTDKLFLEKSNREVIDCEKVVLMCDAQFRKGVVVHMYIVNAY
jgi:hypothetical protein